MSYSWTSIYVRTTCPQWCNAQRIRACTQPTRDAHGAYGFCTFWRQTTRPVGTDWQFFIDIFPPLCAPSRPLLASNRTLSRRVSTKLARSSPFSDLSRKFTKGPLVVGMVKEIGRHIDCSELHLWYVVCTYRSLTVLTKRGHYFVKREKWKKVVFFFWVCISTFSSKTLRMTCVSGCNVGPRSFFFCDIARCTTVNFQNLVSWKTTGTSTVLCHVTIVKKSLTIIIIKNNNKIIIKKIHYSKVFLVRPRIRTSTCIVGTSGFS